MRREAAKLAGASGAGKSGRRPRRLIELVVVMVVFIAGSGVGAYALVGPGNGLPANDLEALLALGQQAPTLTPETIPGPKLKPVRRARCDSGSRPLAGTQGRLTRQDINSSAAKRGWTCNVRKLGRYSTPGGFRVWRYRDHHGHTCAYYDTSLSSPANVASLAGGPSPGVVVLNMRHPAHPVKTDTLTSAAMLAPHESLNLSKRSGLLAAEVGNALTLPGEMALYDVSQDCRHPRLRSQMATITGHESGFSPDGKTFWIAGGAGYIKAVDVSDPDSPRVLWTGAYYSHGLNFSPSGKTLYQTDPINGNLGIFDSSEVQDRKSSPHVTEQRRITWKGVSIPQNTVPLRIHGKRFLLEFDEFAFRFNPTTLDDKVGAARLIDLSDRRHPRIASNLRLRVNQRAVHRRIGGDPTPLPPLKALGYSAHYCAVPREKNPGIVACSFTNSGLRVFDIRRPRHPREVAYFIAPPKKGTVAGLLPGNVALSQPAFDPKHRQVWYTDGGSGFYSLHLNGRAWPRHGGR